MTPTALLSWLRGVGAVVTVRDERLIIDAPSGVVTDELRNELRTHREELLALASQPDDDVIGWRVIVMQDQLPPFPRPAPLLLARPEILYRPGHCISCGDLIKAPRCQPCRDASDKVLAAWANQYHAIPTDD